MTSLTPRAGQDTRRRVFLVEDHPIVREGLAQLINDEPDLTVCGQSDGIEETLREMDRAAPDVVIVDLLLGDSDGLELIRQLSADTGYLDGRYMAATFNLLRGRDLIWSYVVNNYLLGEDYTPFDLLHWNADTTNLPAKWHLAYLQAIYRDNLLVVPGGITIDGTFHSCSFANSSAGVRAVSLQSRGRSRTATPSAHSGTPPCSER